MRSLQLLCTVGGNQTRSDARSEFDILEPSPKGGVKLVVHIAVSTSYPHTIAIAVRITGSDTDINFVFLYSFQVYVKSYHLQVQEECFHISILATK